MRQPGVLQNVRSMVASDERWSQLFTTLVAYIAMLRGDEKGLHQYLEQRQYLNAEPCSLVDSAEREIYATVLCKRGRYREALSVLDLLRKRCIAGDMGDIALKVDICSSAVHAAMGEDEMAKIDLLKALSRAEREMYFQPFSALAQSIIPVLKQIAGDLIGKRPQFLATIFETCGLSMPEVEEGGQKTGVGYHGLTAREIEILKPPREGLQEQ